MNYQIRRATDEDLDSLAHMFISAFAGEPWYETWQFERAKERILEVLSSRKSLCFVYEEDNVIMGCTLWLLMSWHTGFQLEGKELFVDPKHQRRGIGQKLIRHVETVASGLGVTELFLWTTRTGGSTDPDRLIDFYEKLGFNISEDRVVMVKVRGNARTGTNESI